MVPGWEEEKLPTGRQGHAEVGLCTTAITAIGAGERLGDGDGHWASFLRRAGLGDNSLCPLNIAHVSIHSRYTYDPTGTMGRRR